MWCRKSAGLATVQRRVCYWPLTPVLRSHLVAPPHLAHPKKTGQKIQVNHYEITPPKQYINKGSYQWKVPQALGVLPFQLLLEVLWVPEWKIKKILKCCDLNVFFSSLGHLHFWNVSFKSIQNFLSYLYSQPDSRRHMGGFRPNGSQESSYNINCVYSINGRPFSHKYLHLLDSVNVPGNPWDFQKTKEPESKTRTFNHPKWADSQIMSCSENYESKCCCFFSPWC